MVKVKNPVHQRVIDLYRSRPHGDFLTKGEISFLHSLPKTFLAVYRDACKVGSFEDYFALDPKIVPLFQEITGDIIRESVFIKLRHGDCCTVSRLIDRASKFLAELCLHCSDHSMPQSSNSQRQVFCKFLESELTVIMSICN